MVALRAGARFLVALASRGPPERSNVQTPIHSVIIIVTIEEVEPGIPTVIT